MRPEVSNRAAEKVQEWNYTWYFMLKYGLLCLTSSMGGAAALQHTNLEVLTMPGHKDLITFCEQAPEVASI